MPKTPKGAKRPADVVSNAVHIMSIATGEIDAEVDTRNQAALALSKACATFHDEAVHGVRWRAA